MALGLTPPWQVLSAYFDPQQKRLDIQIDFPRGSIFSGSSLFQVTHLKQRGAKNILTDTLRLF
jgi:hypothetical protein